jgi:hypothetical protein
LQRFAEEIEAQRVFTRRREREAAAIDGDAIARPDRRADSGRRYLQTAGSGVGVDCDDIANFFNQAGEHAEWRRLKVNLYREVDEQSKPALGVRGVFCGLTTHHADGA